MIRKNILFLGLASATLLGSVINAGAAVVISTETNNTSRAFYPVSSTDLINGLTATSSTYVGSFEGGAGQASLPALNDGSAGDSNLTTNGQVLFDRDDVSWNVVYTLNSAGAPLGYNITSVASYAGHNDGRVDQNFSFEVMFAGSSTWTLIATPDYDAEPGNANGNFSTKVTISDDTSAPLATNVIAVRFTAFQPSSNIGSAAQGGSIYRELDVFGTPTVPEASSALLGMAGLMGFVARRRRQA